VLDAFLSEHFDVEAIRHRCAARGFQRTRGEHPRYDPRNRSDYGIYSAAKPKRRRAALTAVLAR
jgi:hypothetical protein